MLKAAVAAMNDWRSLINPSGTVHFAFDDVMTEAELERRVRLITDLVYSLGGYLNDGRSEAVALEATDQLSGTDWEGGGDSVKYTRRTGIPKQDRKLSLEMAIAQCRGEQPPDEKFIVYTPRAGIVLMHNGRGYGDNESPFVIESFIVDLRGRLLTVFCDGDDVDINKRDFEQNVSILHRLLPIM